MDYKVLYRKYRPDNFSNIIDQDYITTILKNSIVNNKMSHAYIFSGPRGTGKTSTAKVFAKAINCENITNDGPCNECERCKNFNNNPDIVELDAASNNGVDEIREIIDNVKVAPSYNKYKVYIIDEVHMLTQNAFNALLLTLEEPPKNVVFILATTNIENVPITILSRCQRFDFRKISIDAMVSRLKYVCEKENIKYEDDALISIAKLADGGMRDALGLLDQLSQDNVTITKNMVENTFGVVPSAVIDKVINNFVNNDRNGVISSINDFKNNGYNYKSIVKLTIDLLRGKSVECLNKNNDLDYLKLANVIVDLNKTLNELNVYINPLVLYEICFLKHMVNNNTSNTEKIINNDVVIDDKKTMGNIKENQNYFPGNNFDDYKLKNYVAVRVNNCFVNPQKSILDNVKKMWPKFVDSIYDNNLLSLVVDLKPVCGSDKYFVFESSNAGSAELINLESNNFEQIFSQFFNNSYKIVVLSSNEWEKFKNKYILDTKSGIKYIMKEEISLNNDVPVINNDIISIAGDVFNKDKIEYD